VSAGDSEGRERLLRYCARPPLSLERLQLLPNGLVAYALRRPWGKQTHRVLTPLDFLARLAALIPPPRHPLIVFHGVFAPHSAWRKSVVPCASSNGTGGPLIPCEDHQAAHDSPSCGQRASDQRSPNASGASTSALAELRRPNRAAEDLTKILPRSERGVSPAVSSRIDWAELLKRTYDIDALACPCGGRLSFIATILEPLAAQSILASLGLDWTPPPIARARSPDWFEDLQVGAQDW
jgi:hypothetical protein